MISKNIENIIIKYLNNQASISEFEELEKWLLKKKNEKIFIEYVKVNFLIDINLKEFDLEVSKKKLLEFIYNQKRVSKVRTLRVFLNYAASIIIIFSIFYFYNIDGSKVSSESITLKLSNGDIKALDVKGNFNITDNKGNVIGNQNGKAIVYNNQYTTEELVYNTLTVPYGKTFAIKLSDGTKVNLNAGTTLKYPVSFISGQKREVYLVTGEAYFNVTNDRKHPFVVHNNEIDLEVLGTEFNISAYPEDNKTTTVLVEGSVKLNLDSNDKTSKVLKPGFKAERIKNDDTFKISKADIDVHTAWINGRIILKHMKFKDIIKKLERHYDVQIKNNDKAFGEDYITATFDIETIEQVFEVINQIHSIDYNINDKKIIINNKTIKQMK